MENNKIEESIEKLINGETKELVIKKEDFMQFREIWLSHSEKNFIIGKANHYGEVIYCYKPSVWTKYKEHSVKKNKKVVVESC